MMIYRSYNRGSETSNFLNIVELINHYVKFQKKFYFCLSNGLIKYGFEVGIFEAFYCNRK